MAMGFAVVLRLVVVMKEVAVTMKVRKGDTLEMCRSKYLLCWVRRATDHPLEEYHHPFHTSYLHHV